MRGLYIHVPFCVKKCDYCDFTSFGCCESRIPEYIDAVINESQLYCGESVKTVFLGGGTPSLMPIGGVTRLLEGIKKNIVICDNAEITIECNPCSLTREKLKEYKQCGINRISLGAQSFSDAVLKKIGRSHDLHQLENAIALVGDTGFDNFNLDLIFALPEQTPNEWIDTLERACDCGAKHISCYSLTVCENTPMGKAINSGEKRLPSADDERIMYKACGEILHGHGIEQYEISNYAIPGYECVHNINYWMSGEYIGLGCGAHSYFKGARFYNTCVLNEYIGQKNIVREYSVLNERDKMFEMLMLRLRMNRGLEKSAFKNAFNKEIFEVYGKQLEKDIESGLLVNTCGFLRLTEHGRDFADGMLVNYL